MLIKELLNLILKKLLNKSIVKENVEKATLEIDINPVTVTLEKVIEVIMENKFDTEVVEVVQPKIEEAIQEFIKSKFTDIPTEGILETKIIENEMKKKN